MTRLNEFFKSTLVQYTIVLVVTIILLITVINTHLYFNLSYAESTIFEEISNYSSRTVKVFLPIQLTQRQEIIITDNIEPLVYQYGIYFISSKNQEVLNIGFLAAEYCSTHKWTESDQLRFCLGYGVMEYARLMDITEDQYRLLASTYDTELAIYSFLESPDHIVLPMKVDDK
ncbi:hypothetical protein A2154_04770 [Candidatus Gottesmanbacteria bacterium RBG_16_43_7]|uniref:Uncharacterized protein n=1 Tax=Candidatus Gottesmanbacteria bacterium RBG_16_43_7 TaxID=1798373 RepID=A0A1F5Z7N5_9BACT|nr:MAG: hypothetical protein A2154_04770 [Candidatus Gottesmanbacteria bacterium RBG_16_43_7]